MLQFQWYWCVHSPGAAVSFSIGFWVNFEFRSCTSSTTTADFVTEGLCVGLFGGLLIAVVRHRHCHERTPRLGRLVDILVPLSGIGVTECDSPRLIWGSYCYPFGQSVGRFRGLGSDSRGDGHKDSF